MCHEQWTFTVIKLLKFFVLIFAVFVPDFIFFLYHSGTVTQVSWKLWMFVISTPHKITTFTVLLAVTTNTKETVLQQKCCLDATTQESSQSGHLGDVLVGHHHFVIFAVLDVSFAVNSCLNPSFFTFIPVLWRGVRVIKVRFVRGRKTILKNRWIIVRQQSNNSHPLSTRHKTPISRKYNFLSVPRTAVDKWTLDIKTRRHSYHK